VNSSITGARKLSAVGHLLTRRHAGRYMVWNLSEVEYDVDIFDDQVLTYSFPGSPSPPLGLLLKLFVSLESWLKADSRNVAVLHCLTGKGRTSTVLAAFLCWMGEAQFSDIYQALEYIASCKHVSVDDLTIPSQRRYASYFKNMLDGIRPSQPPLMLKRIIMSEAPRFAKGPQRPNDPTNKNNEDTETDSDDSHLVGCVPYIQVFKAGKLLHTAPASLHFQQAENELPFCRVSDGNISFNVNLVIQGDILVRARHLTPSKKRVSMFRAAFHTGYAPPNVMRFTKLQLDGACTDDRFAPDFFLDFLLEPVSAEEASKLLRSQDVAKETSTDKVESGANAQHGSAVQASAEDSMLYGDSRFWDVIKNRMKENATTTASKTDPFWGPTVGRRRDSKNTQSDLVAPASDNFASVEHPKDGDSLGTFSIGGDMDFLPVVVGSETSQSNPLGGPKEAPPAAIKPAKDSLLEALMGALDDVDVHESNDDDEEVVEFDNAPEASPVTSASTVQPNKPSIVTEAPIVPNENIAVAVTPADDIAALLTEAHDRADEDWDALLSTPTNALTEDELLNLEIDEIDDAELNDLESFLSK
jgi:C2 domain of PTEN tumour-suppressor protein